MDVVTVETAGVTVFVSVTSGSWMVLVEVVSLYLKLADGRQQALHRTIGSEDYS